MKRFFSKSQKVALFLAADGKCEKCGIDLPSGWHGDHVIPWAKGGATDAANGAALCPKCNLSKSDKMNNQDYQLPAGLSLRTWQSEFLDVFFDKVIGQNANPSDPNFLLVATPGAGKTVAQLAAAYNLLNVGIVNWLVICVPTDHLRNQMGRDAHERFGIDLYHGTGFVPESDYQGEVVTYAQVAANPDVWRSRCAKRRVFLSSDEVHHLGDELSWGESYKRAFSAARIRLSTSGTPFRTDNQQIPWIDYQPTEQGVLKSRSDYSYGYGDALKDGVCRHVIFPTFDATCRWLYGFDSFSATFQDSLADADAARRRNVAIDADGEWIDKVFHDANLRLDQIRDAGHDDAGGLIVCRDKIQASLIAQKLESWTGETPVRVDSDMPDASERIKRFAKESGSGASRWIVAVKMVSEGVDIKRLRVAIYATNIITEMYFRQFVGRVIRMIGLEEETAYVYAYPDEALIAHMEDIRAERDHVIKKRDDDEPMTGGKGGGPQLKIFQAIGADDVAESDHVYGGQRFSQVEIVAVRELAAEHGIPEAKLASLMRRMSELRSVPEPASVGQVEVIPQSGETKKERVAKKRKTAQRLTNQLAYKYLEIEAVEVHGMWTRYSGKGHSKSSEETLEKKIYWLKCCIAQQRLISPKDINWGEMKHA